MNWVVWDDYETLSNTKYGDFTYSNNPEGIFLDRSIFTYDYIKSKKVKILFKFSNVTLTNDILLFINAKKYNL